MSLILQWIQEGLPSNQACMVLNGFFKLVQWSKLDASVVQSCNAEFEKGLLQFTGKPTIEQMLLLVAAWIKKYLVMQPKHNDQVSGYIVAHG